MEGPSRQWRGVSPDNAAELASWFGVHLLPAGVFERGGRKKLEIDEEQVKELHAKIGELAVANCFLERKLKPRGGT